MNRNSKALRTLYTVAAVLLAAAFMAGCTFPLGLDDSDLDGGSLTIHLGAGSRTILPDLPGEIATYDVLVDDGSASQTATDQTSFPVVFSGLGAATWTVTVNAKDAGGAIVATGTASVAISADDTVGKTVTVDILPTETGSGSIDVTIGWPADTVDTVSATLTPDGGASQDITFTIAGDGLSARYQGDWAAGSYTLIANLEKSGAAYAPVIEAVQVYDNLTSTATIALDADDLTSPPDAPTDVTVYKESGGNFVVSWTDAANTETSYAIERQLGTDPATVVEPNLPAGTETYIDTTASATALVDYVVRVSAANDFGSSEWVSATVVYPEVDASIGGTAQAAESNYGFGSIDLDDGATVTVVVENTGAAELVITDVSLSGTDAAQFSVDTTGMAAVVAPGGSTSFELTFAPTTRGSKSAALTIANNDADEGNYLINLSGFGFHPYIYVSTGGNDTTGTGDKAAPYATIQKGVDEAAPNGWTVRVADGTYTVDGSTAPITIDNTTGVSGTLTIEGGYQDATWVRDVASYETIIEDSSTGGSTFNSPQTAILVDSLYSGSVVIDGLSVHGASTGTATAGITISGSSATVTINNVTAEGGSGSTHSSGLFVRFYSPNVTITDSTLTGGASANTAGLRVFQAAGADVSGSTVSGGVAPDPGAGDSYSYGITVSGVPGDGSTIAAWNNTINGGTAEYARGIWVGTESDGTITGNTIDGGDTNVADGSATGIYVYDQSNPLIANNWIFSGDAEPDALTDDDEGTVEGIRIDDESDPVIRNNIIIAGLGLNSRGISISAGIDGTLPPSSPVIVNNTIDAGYGETTGAEQGPAWGIAVENTTATMKNNIIYVHGAASSNYGIDTIFADEIVGSPTIEYNYVYVGGGDDTRATDIYAGAGNVTGGAAPGFTAYTADYDPTNDDYNLTDGSPVNVRGGGADLSALGYSDDYLGATRTTAYDTGSGSVTNGGDGWSMGAYELDS